MTKSLTAMILIIGKEVFQQTQTIKRVSTHNLHTSHICHYPIHLGDCLILEHMNLESKDVNNGSRKICSRLRYLDDLCCDCPDPKCLGSY